jgi:RNA polymerase Rpb4
MEVRSKNDGLLTNVEVAEILEARRQRALARRVDDTDPFDGGSAGSGSSSSSSSVTNFQLQHKDFVEKQTIKYIRRYCPYPADKVAECLKRIKAMNVGLTEGEMLGIANIAPKFIVEVHLVSHHGYHGCRS